MRLSFLRFLLYVAYVHETGRDVRNYSGLTNLDFAEYLWNRGFCYKWVEGTADRYDGWFSIAASWKLLAAFEKTR